MHQWGKLVVFLTVFYEGRYIHNFQIDYVKPETTYNLVSSSNTKKVTQLYTSYMSINPAIFWFYRRNMPAVKTKNQVAKLHYIKTYKTSKSYWKDLKRIKS